jgi:ribonuclease P protein component
MGKFTFRKEERLSKENDIQELFGKGSSFYLFPFKIIWLRQPAQQVHRVLISVSKKSFKRAVDRNKIKRQIRENYRINKEMLPGGITLDIGLIYTHKEILPAQEFSQKMVHALRRISSVSRQIPPKN